MSRARKRVALLLLCAMMLSLIAPESLISVAVSKPKLSKSKATFLVGTTKTIKVKCSVPGKISVQSLNPYFCGVTKVKKSMKKNSPAYFKLKGLCAGYSIIAIHVKLKRKIKGKKEFDLRFHAYTTDKPSPTPSVTPTITPKPTNTPMKSATPSPTKTPGASPTGSPKVTKSPTPSPSKSPSASPTVTPTAIPTRTPSPTPIPTPEDPDNYTITFTHNQGSGVYITGMPATVKIPKNGNCKFVFPEAPVAEGHRFLSWIYHDDPHHYPGDTIIISKDEVIKAYFQSLGAPTGPIIQYETGAMYHPEIRGVISGKRLYNYGDHLIVTDIVPSWTGHEFKGWQRSGYDRLYHAGDVISDIYSDFTLYAVWDP